MSRPFTIEYSQPAEYRFSLDSVEAPAEIARALDAGPLPAAPLRVLDLCAGCGVMGMELAFHRAVPMAIDFAEIQDVYEPHWRVNWRRLKESDARRGLSRGLEGRWLGTGDKGLRAPGFAGRYDLVISNPPYFLPGQGRLSGNGFKDRCRFFLDTEPEHLWETIEFVLKPGAPAYVLARSLDEHGPSPWPSVLRRLRYRGRISKWKDIRGTDLLLFRKNGISTAGV